MLDTCYQNANHVIKMLKHASNMLNNANIMLIHLNNNNATC